MSNPKVFEFAKEIGMSPLALMDKIREWQLPVKSHMAELDSDTLAMIKVKLKEPAKPADAPAEKKTARKKPAAAAAEKAAATPKTATRPATKAAKAAAPAAATAAPAAAKTTVVRRKKADMDAEAAAAAEAEESAAPVAETAAPVTEEAPAPAAPATPRVETAAPPAAAAAPVETPVTPAPASAPAAPAPAAAAAASAPAAEDGPAAERKPIVARKKEVAIGNSGVSSEAPAASTIGKRNIIGRMDLSRVQAPAGPRPGGGGYRPGGGTGGQQGAGPGGLNRSRGNLRAGFVQQSAPPPVVGGDMSAEEARKRDERRRGLKGGTADATAARDAEAAPPAFDAAEFRKREMVFQPKKKKGMLSRPSMQTQKTTAAAHKRILKVNGTMKVADVAAEMGLKVAELTKVLMKNGVMATPNTPLDFDTLALIVPDFGWEAQNVLKTAEAVIKETAFGDLDAELVTRPPVVTIMGHVDHGKTSLLDAIRSAKVAEGEAGGITQHIGAYQVSLDDGYKITFLDTPGHEAFTAMRARGANVTDIAIVVVAADDGVMPQTAEAISHAKAAGVPMIIAVNKMDKPGANPDRVKQQLTEYEVVPEEWGGSTIFVGVSALKKTGLDELLVQIKLLAEMAELKANPARSGTGTVIEARLEKGRGPVASLLVKDGTVRVGQHIVAGTVVGRVRSLTNDRGERVQEATPGMPIEVLGLDDVPVAGDLFDVVIDESTAEEAAGIRKSNALAAKQKTGKISLEEIFAKVKTGDVKELVVVLKTDVHGSLEALQGMFSKLSTPEVKVRIIHSGVGGITESDVLLASTAKGLIIGFNVRPDGNATNAAKRMGIEIRTYSIVYELIDDMKKAMGGLLAPTVVEKVMGRAEVRNVFTVPKIGAIAGCFIVDGKINRSNMARLIRDGKIVYEGKIGSLKRFKDDAREVATGFECGIGIENFNDVKVGDVIEAFTKEEVARTLDSGPSAEA
ncbi:MAG: translation initiation factor IF-2 [Bdellovibrionaceae bacterium]|nr:translation initiation factor IF-2 [Pseudobdellovibrionaceae bacterium]